VVSGQATLSDRKTGAPEMDDAIIRPRSKGTTLSCLLCVTNVGASTFGNRSMISMSSQAFLILMAFSGDVVTRCSSPNHLICSVVPSGSYSELNACMNAELG
jgi:hypothetical protein